MRSLFYAISLVLAVVLSSARMMKVGVRGLRGANKFTQTNSSDPEKLDGLYHRCKVVPDQQNVQANGYAMFYGYGIPGLSTDLVIGSDQTEDVRLIIELQTKEGEHVFDWSLEFKGKNETIKKPWHKNRTQWIYYRTDQMKHNLRLGFKHRAFPARQLPTGSMSKEGFVLERKDPSNWIHAEHIFWAEKVGVLWNNTNYTFDLNFMNVDKAREWVEEQRQKHHQDPWNIDRKAPDYFTPTPDYFTPKQKDIERSIWAMTKEAEEGKIARALNN